MKTAIWTALVVAATGCTLQLPNASTLAQTASSLDAAIASASVIPTPPPAPTFVEQPVIVEPQPVVVEPAPTIIVCCEDDHPSCIKWKPWTCGG